MALATSKILFANTEKTINVRIVEANPDEPEAQRQKGNA